MWVSFSFGNLFKSKPVIYWMQYRERVIFIGEEINEEFSNQLLGTLLYLDSIDNSKKIRLYINCPGGDVSFQWFDIVVLFSFCYFVWVTSAKICILLQLTPSLALYDTMQSLQSPIATYCIGFAYNLAALVLAGGEKVWNLSSVWPYVWLYRFVCRRKGFCIEILYRLLQLTWLDLSGWLTPLKSFYLFHNFVPEPIFLNQSCLWSHGYMWEHFTLIWKVLFLVQYNFQ